MSSLERNAIRGYTLPEATDLLVDVARSMERAHGLEHPRHDFWQELARWLSDVADKVTGMYPDEFTSDPEVESCIKVALSYKNAEAPHDQE